MRISKGEAIEMLARRYDYFPASFRWRGRRFEVIGVEKCWTVAGSPARRLFRVRCAAGRFTLEQILSPEHTGQVTDGEQWRVKSSPLKLWLARSTRATSPRYPLPKSEQRAQRRGKLALATVDHPAKPARKQVQRERVWTPIPQRT